jgi:hypothetical protein
MSEFVEERQGRGEWFLSIRLVEGETNLNLALLGIALATPISTTFQFKLYFYRGL